MKSDFLSQLRIASPCSVGWESMTGSDRVRLCSQCDLHVYDFSELTRAEAAALLAKSEGRICARLHRRADGTVITRDCPVGLRSIQRRVARRAGAALTAILSLSGGGFAQARPQDDKSRSNTSVIKIEKQQSAEQEAMVSGTVTDLNGGVIVKAKITLIDNATQAQFTTATSDDGEFRFAELNAGKYTLEVETPFFKRLIVQDLLAKAGDQVRLELMLEVSPESIQTGMIEVAVEPIPVPPDAPISTEVLRKRPN